MEIHVLSTSLQNFSSIGPRMIIDRSCWCWLDGAFQKPIFSSSSSPWPAAPLSLSVTILSVSHTLSLSQSLTCVSGCRWGEGRETTGEEKMKEEKESGVVRWGVGKRKEKGKKGWGGLLLCCTWIYGGGEIRGNKGFICDNYKNAPLSP